MDDAVGQVRDGGPYYFQSGICHYFLRQERMWGKIENGHAIRTSVSLVRLSRLVPAMLLERTGFSNQGTDHVQISH